MASILKVLVFVTSFSIGFCDGQQNATDDGSKKQKRIIPLSECYGVLGCFSTGGAFFDLRYRPIQLLPQERHQINTTFRLYTRQNPSMADILIADVDRSLVKSHFKQSAETKMIVHGFIDHGLVRWIVAMKNEFLLKDDYNVIVVDWGRGSSVPYMQATANTRIVGAEIAYLINKLERIFSVKPETFHVIGHSLGAHIGGYAGERLTHLGRITGMDPADPYFSGTHRAVRLDPTDALFVDVIHSDGDSIFSALINEGGFGLWDAIGHVDFYPNGGADQPGCDKDISVVIVDGLYEGGKQFIACDHLRAYELFSDSINNNCKYKAYPCDNWDAYKEGICSDCGIDGCSFMGLDADTVPKPAQERTTYYLETGDSAPHFCRYHIFIRIELEDDSRARTEKGKVFANVIGDRATGEVLLHDDGNRDFTHGRTYFFRILSEVDIGQPRQILFRWEHNPSWLKPWQWGLLHSAKLYVSKITVINGETMNSAIFCGLQPVDDDTVETFDTSSTC